MTDHPIITAIVLIVASYLLGSISFAVIMSKLFVKKDVRDFGSGSAGMTNVMRTAGKLPGILTFILDFAKGFGASLAGKLIFAELYKATSNDWFAPIFGALCCSLACLLGHVFPVFFQFKGGKGVATGVGAYFAISPLAALLGLVSFAIIFAITRIVSVGSLVGTAVVVLCAITFKLDFDFAVVPQILLGLAMGGTIFAKHKANIVRLIHGEEKKLTVKK